VRCQAGGSHWDRAHRPASPDLTDHYRSQDSAQEGRLRVRLGNRDFCSRSPDEVCLWVRSVSRASPLQHRTKLDLCRNPLACRSGASGKPTPQPRTRTTWRAPPFLEGHEEARTEPRSPRSVKIKFHNELRNSTPGREQRLAAGPAAASLA